MLPTFMSSRLPILLSALFTTCAVQAQAADAPAEVKNSSPIEIVKDGKPAAVIVLSARLQNETRTDVESFVKIVQRSTGAKLDVVKEGGDGTYPPDMARIYIGPSEQTTAAGLSADKLEEESYRILTMGNSIHILGSPNANQSSNRPKPVSKPTLWALNRILEEQLGVRWLWPGELGTYVPKSSSLIVPPMNVTYQPKLSLRSLWLQAKYSDDAASETKIRDEAISWVENHQAGKRGGVKFGHAFGDWWKKYGATHPDYFGETLPGLKQPYNSPERAKLRLANPAVIEQIAQEYKDAGAPTFWNVCPNDGSFFDVSAETRAWDIPQNQSVEDIWKAKANLTGRYVKFWNLVYERLREINPDVILCTYAYSAYKTPPPAERPLTAKMAIGLVHSYEDYDHWKAWGANGAMLFLRPNWWHYGANGANLPLQEISSFLKFAWENDLHGMSMDSILGYWGTQGPSYYLVARMMTRPDLSEEAILEEYASAFGVAAPKIREYLAYWQKLSSEYRYMSPEGKFVQLMKDKKIDPSVTRGARQALPHLYSEEVVAPAYGILEEASTLVGSSDPEAAERINFLKNGLTELRATRDLVTLSEQLKKNRNKNSMLEFEKKSQALEELRRNLTPSHAIWGSAVSTEEDRRKVYILPRVKKPVGSETDEI